jgi:hypothetical protein
MADQTDIAARLAAAWLRVKPLVWDSPSNRFHTVDPMIWATSGRYSVECLSEDKYVACTSTGRLHVGTRAECIAACERHHAEAVLAMSEPSE